MNESTGHSEAETVGEGELLRLAAFTDNPQAGNPAGVWIGDTPLGDDEMQRVATEVGYSETAFVVPSQGQDRTVRFFSPEAEVSFCGHATIAIGVALGQAHGDGAYRLNTPAGDVRVDVTTHDGVLEAALTSVEPRYSAASTQLLTRSLSVLSWEAADLDPAIPPAKAFAGNWHLVIAVSEAKRLAELSYDFDGLKSLMLQEGLTTLQLIWREDANTFRSRNPFPVGGVIEDPATGAAAAALGGYLRGIGQVAAPAKILIKQGDDMGRPSRLTVDIPAAGGIIVKGTAVLIQAGRGGF
ncbi:putative isomerase YddE [Posidoniimonas polymericola]|uniref:Putative isomerase YddE n=1 Tax=Posidoniimonas polymericola TaxID=2528002 RepID=A0A5C5XRS7_9BACT|nr:PhzF family phenazine biosynthesis isomerase [Posidoniimonas polymericola]TWT65946.1 putative isomerase YddE [Posidoniimonas polymericola]